MTERKQFRELADPEDLHEVISSLDLSPGTESVPLLEADGRVLAERIDAEIDVPGFDRSTMDGYAVRGADTFGATEADPAVLDVVGTVEAGDTPDISVPGGGAAEVATGASMPPEADAVVPVERTTRDSGRVEIRTAVAPGENVMHSGDDVAAGDRAIGPGTVLRTRDVGLLAALGLESVPVLGRPRVGIVSTGDELVRPGEPRDVERGQIYDLNTYALAAAVRAAGGEPVILPHIEDDYDRMRSALESAGERCDLVLSSGSTSASEGDVLYRVVEEHGRLDLHGVSVKPGRPTIVGEVARTPYVGLPGNPVSALSIYRTFLAPAIRSAAGRPPASVPSIEGRMVVSKRYAEGRTYLLPVAIVEDGGGEILVYPVDKGSGAITSLTEADGVVKMAPETELLEAGESVTVYLFSADGRPPSVLGIGESDPLVSRLLDHLDGPRYLPHGTGEGRRRFRDGVADFAVLSERDAEALDGAPIAEITREWGLVVPAGNPGDIDGLADLRGGPSFYNVPRDTALRQTFDAALDEMRPAASPANRGEEISGYDRTVSGIRSPARRVAAGEADVGLGVRASTADLDVDFVPVGKEVLTVLANPDRAEKSGLQRLRELTHSELSSLAAELSGYTVSEPAG